MQSATCPASGEDHPVELVGTCPQGGELTAFELTAPDVLQGLTRGGRARENERPLRRHRLAKSQAVALGDRGEHARLVRLGVLKHAEAGSERLVDPADDAAEVARDLVKARRREAGPDGHDSAVKPDPGPERGARGDVVEHHVGQSRVGRRAHDHERGDAPADGGDHLRRRVCVMRQPHRPRLRRPECKPHEGVARTGEGLDHELGVAGDDVLALPPVAPPGERHVDGGVGVQHVPRSIGDLAGQLATGALTGT
jgi:hypothetical protein